MSQPEPLSDMERYKLEYKELGDSIRHFSTVRATLTTFLTTAGLVCLAVMTRVESGGIYLLGVGLLFLCSALFVSLSFSRRTETHVLRQIALRDWSHDPGRQTYPGSMKMHDPKRPAWWWIEQEEEVRRRMRKDPMNRLLFLVVGTVILLVLLAIMYDKQLRHALWPESPEVITAAEMIR